jgi:hypothetical protein
MLSPAAATGIVRQCAEDCLLLDRTARLAVTVKELSKALKRTAVGLHDEKEHKGPFEVCGWEPCKGNRELIERAKP